MALRLDRDGQAALDLAKRSVPEGRELDARLLLSALYHGTALRERFPELARHLPEPKPVRNEIPDKVTVAKPLRPVLGRLARPGEVVTAAALFQALVESEAGRDALLAQGLGERDLTNLLAPRDAPASPPAASGWRTSPERAQAIEALASYGRMLTAVELPSRDVAEMEPVLQALIRTLTKPRRRSAILVGPPGTGKTVVVYELARRLAGGHPSIPARLRDLDVFELSPAFLRAGASVVGEYEERLKALIQILQSHPNIVLFVDEIHSLLQSAVHGRTPFTEANESFKGVLGRDIACLGATTLAEYRHFIEPDGALARRFKVIRIAPPTRQATLRILEARRPRMERHYHPLRIPDAMLERAIDLSDDHLPSRYQPDNAIQLLDDACAHCVTQEKPPEVVTEDALWSALEDTIGRSLARSEALSEDGVFERLRTKIIGHDEVLREIARAFVAGLGGWAGSSGPRGVFFFCGPTGVGKTETALKLAEILGGGRDALLTVNCNTLQGWGRDIGPAINVLLGVPPGYAGYARGQGGVLSRVRDVPESVVLFDEIEKADPGIGKLLLQILDKGRIEDTEGNPLDFRRSFIVFTTNSGCAYDAEIGFGQAEGAGQVPRVEVEAVKADLRARGFGEEFFGRIGHWFVFESLDPAEVREVIEVQLQKLRGTAEMRGYALDWDPEVLDRLASAWQPRFGVRHLITILRHRIVEHLSVAEVQGELHGVERIRLALAAAEGGSLGPAGLGTRERCDGALVFTVA